MTSRWDRTVRCSDGHLYHTLWMPFGSLKAVRWFNRRYQRCPIDGRWRWTVRVDESTLTPAERAEAATHHDLAII